MSEPTIEILLSFSFLFIVSFNSRCLFGSFLMISFCCTSHFVHAFFYWVHWLAYLCSLEPLSLIKIIIFQVTCRSPSFWGQLLGKLLYTFGVVMFPCFFMFLLALYVCLPLWLTSHLLQHFRLWKYFQVKVAMRVRVQQGGEQSLCFQEGNTEFNQPRLMLTKRVSDLLWPRLQRFCE